MLIRKKKGKDELNITEREPYTSFLKEWKRKGSELESISLTISSSCEEKDTVKYRNGFCLDYTYSDSFTLDFDYFELIDSKTRKEKFLINHVISYTYSDDSYTNLMQTTIEDIQKRSLDFYISSLVESCEVSCSMNSSKKVQIVYNVFCDRNDAKEVSLQLISHDIALFSRSF